MRAAPLNVLAGKSRFGRAFFRWVSALSVIVGIAQVSHAQPVLKFSEPLEYYSGAEPISISAADVNGDGKTDLAIGARDQFFRVFFGNSDGSFQPSRDTLVPGGRWSLLATGDLNRDGLADVVVVSDLAETNAVMIYLSKGDGTFSEAPLPGAPQGVRPALAIGRPTPVLADFTGDGILDLALAEPNLPGIAQFNGNGDGTFNRGPVTKLPHCAQASCAADLNHDGRADLVTVHHHHGLAVLDGTGVLMAQTAGTNGVFERAMEFAVADFNRDGQTDLALVHQHRLSDVSVMLGDGNGLFPRSEAVPSGNIPNAIAAADFDLDGSPDIVTANWQSGDLTIMLGRGDGSFELPFALAVGMGAYEVVAADFNGDGRADLACLNYLEQKVRVFLNLGQPESVARPKSASQPSLATREADPVEGHSFDRKMFQITSWTSDNGLPQNNVAALLQTRDGFLWVGTQNGLARFDGRRFRTFDSPSDPALLRSAVTCLAEASDGALWIGTMTGLGVLRNGRFRSFDFPWVDGTPTVVETLVARTDGTLWTPHQQGLAILNGNTFSFNRASPLAGMGRLYQSSSGMVWARRGADLFRLDSLASQPDLITSFCPYAEMNLRREAFLEDRQGRFWFGGYSDLFCWERGTIRLVEQRMGFVNSVAEDSAGRVWAGTSHGLRLVSPYSGLTFTKKDGLTDSYVNVVYPDRDGNVWLGTPNGLNLLRTRGVLNYTVEDGLPDDDVWSITQSRDGSLWIGTRAGATRFRDGSFDRYASSHPLLWVLEDAAGDIWAGGGGRLLQMRDSIFHPVSHPGVVARSASLDRLGVFWTNHEMHLLSRVEEEWSLRTPDIFVTLDIRGAAVLRDAISDALWVGTEKHGLFKIAGTETTRFTTKEGLTSDLVGPALIEPDGTLWAVSDKGLNRLKNGKITRYTTQQGLAENIVLNVLADDDGWFWLNGHRGIHRIRKQELDELAEGKRTSVETVSYGTAQGLLSAEGNGGLFPNSCRSRDGLLWFPTIKGLVMIDPKEVRLQTNIPPVSIDRILANDQVVLDFGAIQQFESERVDESGEPRLSFAPGAAEVLQIEFASPSFVAPERTRFKYQLKGYDRDWRDASLETRAVYTRLLPGDYEFLVKARSSMGVWNEAAARIAFRVQPHFYQTTWFYFGCLALALAFLGGLHTLRVRYQRRLLVLEREASLARERERIARDLHDDVGASLTRIAMLSDAVTQHGELNGVTRQVERISALSREVIDNMSELVWAANPRFDDLQSFAAYVREYTAQLFSTTEVTVRFEIDPGINCKLSSQTRRDLFLVIKEALNNILKHSGATEVLLSIRLVSENLTIDLCDNGKGFPATPRELGNGLRNMRQRVEQLGGTFQQSSPATGGTLLRIDLPTLKLAELKK